MRDSPSHAGLTPGSPRGVSGTGRSPRPARRTGQRGEAGPGRAGGRLQCSRCPGEGSWSPATLRGQPALGTPPHHHPARHHPARHHPAHRHLAHQHPAHHHPAHHPPCLLKRCKIPRLRFFLGGRHYQLSADPHNQVFPDVTPKLPPGREGGPSSHCEMAEVTCSQSHPTLGNADVPLANHPTHSEKQSRPEGGS